MSGIEFLLDTNVVIGHLAGRDDASQLFARHGVVAAHAAISQITRIELLCYPSISPHEEKRVRDFICSVTVILLDEEIEAAAIRIRRTTRLDLIDAINLATASTRGIFLLTFDAALQRAFEQLQL